MTPKSLPLGPVMLDVEGPRLTEADRKRLGHPLAGGVILALLIWKSARERDRQHEQVGAPDKLEPPDLPYPMLESHPADEVFAVMGDCFPEAYGAYFEGRLTPTEQRDLWTMCCAVMSNTQSPSRPCAVKSAARSHIR